jgi:hypothetical protein
MTRHDARDACKLVSKIQCNRTVAAQRNATHRDDNSAQLRHNFALYDFVLFPVQRVDCLEHYLQCRARRLDDGKRDVT